MSSSPFANDNLWSHAKFLFLVKAEGDDLSTVDDRGNQVLNTKTISVTFKINPRDYVSQNQGNLGEDVKSETYEGRVVAVDDDYDKLTFPKSISPSDVGVGVVEGRACRCIIDRIAQSSLNPLLKDILGEKVSLKVTYSMVRSANGI